MRQLYVRPSRALLNHYAELSDMLKTTITLSSPIMTVMNLYSSTLINTQNTKRFCTILYISEKLAEPPKAVNPHMQ